MSNLPGVYGSRVDGGLRLPGPSVDGIHMKIGQAVAGPFNTVIVESDPDTVTADFTQGLLVESLCGFLDQSNPALANRINCSTAGAFALTPTVVVQFVATLATGALTVLPVVVLDEASGLLADYGMLSVEADFSLASLWDGGNLVFTGFDPLGAAQTETLLQATIVALGAGPRSWVSTKVWKAGTLAISKSATGASTGTCTIIQSNKVGQGNQTSDALLTITGVPSNRFEIGVRITRLGNVAGPTPAFNYTLDGQSWTGDIAMPVGGVYALPAFTGLTLNFAGALIQNGDQWFEETVAPTWSTGDLSAAFIAGNASPYDFEGVHVIGPMDAVSAAVISVFITAAENQSSPKWYIVYGEVRDVSPAIGAPPEPETEAAWVNAITGASPGFENFGDYRISMSAGFANILDPPSGRINRRSAAWPYVARLMSISVGTDPAETDLGPLVGVSQIFHDEDLREALDSQRFTTLRTFGRLTGFYVTLGRLMCPLGSDYRKIQFLRVINKCMRLVYDSLLFYVNTKIKVNGGTSIANGNPGAPGTILEQQARAIELPIITLLNQELRDKQGNPDITEPRVQINRTDNIIVTDVIRAKCGIVPCAYGEKIQFTIGLLNPAIEVQ